MSSNTLLKVNREPKESVQRFLKTRYANYGPKFFKYLFGWKVAHLFEDQKHNIDILNAIAVALTGKFYVKQVL